MNIMGIIDDCWEKRTTENSTENPAQVFAEALLEVLKSAYVDGWIDAKKNIKEENLNSNQHMQDNIKPTVVCLCGSTRFSKAFREANLKETIEGKIVLSIGCDFKSDDALSLTIADKERLDELHKRKIDLSDEVLILNVNKYIGESTKSELNYAIEHGKKIRYLVV